MTDFGAERLKDPILLVGRILLLLLYIMNGWQKLTHFSDTIDYMSQVGAPVPMLSAAIAVIVELILAIACAVGLFTRPLAIIFATYTVATSFIGHQYWIMAGAARVDNMEHFFKNIGLVGGFLVLYVVGPGLYAFDARLGGIPWLRRVV